MSQYRQRGFVACRKLGGGAAIQKTFAVSAAASDAYFIGDAVTLSTNGKVTLLKNASTAAPLGVITALYSSSNGKPKPLTFNQPTSGPYLATAQAGFAQVNIDANQTYIVEFGGNITQAGFGGAVKVSAGAPNTSTGLSGQSLSSTISTSADAQFQIIGLAPVELLDNRTSAASVGLVEVKMHRSIFGGNAV